MRNADISIATRNSCLNGLPSSLVTGVKIPYLKIGLKIVKLFKKGDSSNCDNWCGIFLSRVTSLAGSY